MDYFKCFGQYDSDAFSCECCPYSYECQEEAEKSLIHTSLGEY